MGNGFDLANVLGLGYAISLSGFVIWALLIAWYYHKKGEEARG